MDSRNPTHHFQVYGRGSAQAEIRKGSLDIPLKKRDFYFPAGEYVLIKYEVESYNCLAVIPKEVWERELPYMKDISQELLISAQEKTPVNLETIISDKKIKIKGIPLSHLQSLGLNDKSKVVIAWLSEYFSLWRLEDFKEFSLKVDDADKIASELNL